MKKSLLCGLAALAACSGQAAPPAPAHQAASPGPMRDADLGARLAEIARTYEAFGRVDDEARWAPWLCRSPEPSRVQFSRAEAASPHGRKLYFVFAKDHTAYEDARQQAQPVGQVVVKESWIPAEVAPGEEPRAEAGSRLFGEGCTVRYARREGRLYRARERAGLYIMIKTGSPETDGGWAYGTVSADGTVTSSGRVASCVSCHENAKPDRLFGVAWTVK